jgi:hypothetical protein
VVTFDGEDLNSSIIHGSDQRWSKDVLISELRREIGLSERDIANAKVHTTPHTQQRFTWG